MIKIFKQRRNNPSVAEFKRFKLGYHVTKESGLYLIQKSGFLKPNSHKNLATYWQADFYEYFEKGFTPLFFANSISTLLKNFYINENSKVLEVDIKNFAQFPDLPMLANKAKTTIAGLYWDYQVPFQFGDRMKLNEIVPFEEFFTNRRLGNAVISYTRSVTIMENIPVENIISIKDGWEILNDNQYY